MKVPAPTNPDGTPVPDGSTFESDNPAIVVDPNTGEVTVKVVVAEPKATTDTDNNDPKHDDATGNSVKETTQIATNEVVNRRQSDASTKYQAKLPETGEESNMGILAGTAILFAVGALGKRKKKED